MKEYIANLLHSIERAKDGFKLEIFVVDNDSGDDSVAFLKARFPNVHYIENDENVGFGKANNQAIKKASGKYTLIINPDTLVSEDTFNVLSDYMNEHPFCGAAGCKILNPDGTFAPESRRSVPSIWSSLTKITGLSSLFPESKLFGQYYLSWRDEDEPGEVPVLSGSFMFWRSSLLKELGGFDERFFMYGEDIDLCYRVESTEYHLDYVPETSIIHYKGESSKKGDLRYIRVFNKALYQFFDKHYSSRYSLLFRIFIFMVIWVKAFASLIINNFRSISALASDLILLNISVALGFLIRFKFSYEVFSNLQNLKFLWINLLASLIYVTAGSFLGLFRSNKDSISGQLKAVIVSYAGVALVTFFVRDYAFSRLALIIGCGVGVILLVGFKLIQINLSKTENKVTGKLNRLKVLLVGDGETTEELKAKIHSRPDWNYEVIGTISVNEESEEALGSLPQLQDLIKAYKVDQVFFSLNSIAYKDMLKQISILQNDGVLFKLIPDSMDFILGKSNVEYLESIPLVEVEFGYKMGLNPFIKRVFDIAVSIPMVLILFLFTFPSILFSKKKRVSLKGSPKFYRPFAGNKWKNRLVLSWSVLKGTTSLVGSPIYSSGDMQFQSKPGYTGLIQLNQDRIQSNAEAENFELYYLQNYSFWMDLDILIKTMVNGSDLWKKMEHSESH